MDMKTRSIYVQRATEALMRGLIAFFKGLKQVCFSWRCTYLYISSLLQPDMDIDLDISSKSITPPKPQKPMPANVHFQSRENPVEEYTADTSAGSRPAPKRLPPLKDPPTLLDHLYKEKLVEEINLQNKKTRNKKKYGQKVQV